MTRTIVFVKPQHHYQSYDDFWRLVEVSGFTVVDWKSVDLKLDVTYIFTPWNGEVADALAELRVLANGEAPARVIWWNLERDLADADEATRRERLDKVVPPPESSAGALVDDIWVSDRTYATLDQRFHHVVLGGHPNFVDLKSVLFRRREWAAMLYAYVWGRRQMIVDDLVRYFVTLAPPAWTLEEKARVLSGTQVMINTHQYDAARTIAPIRFAVAASYGMSLVSEPIDDPWPLVRDEHFIEVPTERLGVVVSGADRGGDPAAHTAPALFDLLVDTYRFDRAVRAGVESSCGV